MWRKNRNSLSPSLSAASVIDHGCEMEGRFSFVGTLVLNGKLKGDIISGDSLIVGKTGELEGEVSVGNAILEGQLSGNISVRERIELRKTGRVIGNISTPLVVIEEGAVFDGQCKIKGEQAEVIQIKSTKPSPSAERIILAGDSG